MATGESSSSSQDLYSILGISKSASLREITKAYKSLAMKWHPDRNPANKREAHTKFVAITEAYKALNERKKDQRQEDDESTTADDGSDQRRSKDDTFFTRRSSFMTRSRSRSQTPTPSPISVPRSASRAANRTVFPGFTCSPGTSRETTPTSTRSSPSDPFRSPLNISTPTFVASTLKNRRSASETELPSSFSRTTSRAGGTPIVFSHSTVRRKPPPIETKLQCTLEELCNGTVKKIKITRDAITKTGIVKEEEILKIKIKPGWKKGTTISFEGKGDEKPGYLPADIIFSIDEKRHPLFKRIGDDLEIGVEIPLLSALTGCTITVPLLGGGNIDLSLEDQVIYPGYEKTIPGQGMPNSKDGGARGVMRIKFLVGFPTQLTDEQRYQAYDILKDAC